jgi:integrase
MASTGTVRKRSNYGQGSVYYNKARDHWEAMLELGPDDNGNRNRKKLSAGTEQDVTNRLREEQANLKAGLPVGNDSLTVESLLTRWLSDVVPGRVAPTAKATYRWAIENHLVPGLGHVRVRKLTPEHVESFLGAKAAAGLSRSTCVRLRSVLGQALRWAERRGYVGRNVASLAEVPVKARPAREGRALTESQTRALLVACEEHRLHAAFVVMLGLGLRPGEATGLRWSDVDLDGRVLHVRQALKWHDGVPVVGDPKTKRSRRSLAMPALVVDALRAHKARYATDRLAFGQGWPAEWADLVFVSEAGTPIDPANLRRAFSTVAKKANLGHLRPYDARHSACSLLCAAGVPLEHVADVLGHESTRMASQVYRHAIAPSVTAAVEPMERLLREQETLAG